MPMRHGRALPAMTAQVIAGTGAAMNGRRAVRGRTGGSVSGP
jgi:hypothetical protein